MDRRKQEALERLARMEPRELSGEAKAEVCRATRDLRSCGRAVHLVIGACGHACLCAECRQRCDCCPICRTPLTSSRPDRLRLYEQCVEAGLIRDDPDAQSGSQDVRRLCSFFDVALDNNLASLGCHYVTEVCMDEGAVSSNALVSMLLDGGVVKDWCKRTFLIITRSLRDIYSLGSKQMQSKADVLDRSGRKLEGIIQILEALEAPLLEHHHSPSLQELQQLLEAMRKVLQHVEVMAWCTRHRFLESVAFRYTSIGQWRTAVKERKSAAQGRAWPEHMQHKGQLGSRVQASLFIEDALANLGLAKDDEDEGMCNKDALELGWLRQPVTAPMAPSLRHRREAGALQTGVLYPPDSVRAAVDLLFLEGSSDLILAKKAIFLYYLFDRHWTLSDGHWRGIVDDYVGTFGIPRHLMLESLVFYLLDDSTEQALEEACRLLPEIASHSIHPKVPRVLLERHKPEAALAILRASRRDGQMGGAVSLPEALTTVRVWLDCGLLTEGYLYQRLHCESVKREGRDWAQEMEVLVGEICWLCIRMSLLDRMLMLPWQGDEEKVVRMCLLERASQDPSSAAGNLLLVFYIQRCRYLEAHAVHKRLCDLEQQWMALCSDDAKLARVRIACEQRTRITEKCMELLPEVQRQQALTSSEGEAYQPQPLMMDVEQHASVAPVASPLFGSGAEISGREPSQLDDVNIPSTSAWADFRPPSILHGRPFRSATAHSPLIPHISLPNGLTTAQEYGSPGGSPVQGRHLRFEAEPSRDSPSSVGDVRSMDSLDLAVPGSWGAGHLQKMIGRKLNGSGIAGNGLPLTAENGSQKTGLQLEEEGIAEIHGEVKHSSANGKRKPLDQPWLHSRPTDQEVRHSNAPPDADGWDGPPTLPGTIPSELLRRGTEMVENGGGRWRTDETDDEQLPALTTSHHRKAISESQGRLPGLSRFYNRV